MPHLLTSGGGNNSVPHGAPNGAPHHSRHGAPPQPQGSDTSGMVRGGGPHSDDIPPHSVSASNRNQSDSWGYPRHGAAGEAPAPVDSHYHGWHGGGMDERMNGSMAPGAAMSSSPGGVAGVESGPGAKQANPSDTAKEPGRADFQGDSSLRNEMHSSAPRERVDLGGPNQGNKRGPCDEREMAARSMLQLPHSPPSSKDTPASMSSVDADAMTLKDHTIKSSHHGGEPGPQDSNVAVVTPNVTSGAAHQPSPHDQGRPHGHDYDRSRYGQHLYHDQRQGYHYEASGHHGNRAVPHETGAAADGSMSNAYPPPYANYRPQAPPGSYPPPHHAPPGPAGPGGYYPHSSHTPPTPHSHPPPHVGYGHPPQNEQHGAPPTPYYPRHHHSSPSPAHHHGYGPMPHGRHDAPPSMHQSGRQMSSGYYPPGQHFPVQNGQHDQPGRDPNLSPPSTYPDQRSNYPDQRSSNPRGPPPPRWSGRQEGDMGNSMKQTSPSASFDSESTTSSGKELPCEAMTPNSSTASRMISPSSMAPPSHHGGHGDYNMPMQPSPSRSHSRDGGNHHKGGYPYQSSPYPPPPNYYGQHPHPPHPQQQPHQQHLSSRYPHHQHHPPQPPNPNPSHMRHHGMPPQSYGHQNYPHNGGQQGVHGGAPPMHGGGPARGQQNQYPMGMSPPHAPHGPHANVYGYNPSYPHQHHPPHHGAPPQYPHPPHHHEGQPGPPPDAGGPPPQKGGPPPPGKGPDVPGPSTSGAGGAGSSCSAPPISPSSSTSSAGKRAGSPTGDGRYSHQHPHQEGQGGGGAQSINSVAQWQQAQRVTGVAPSANRCVPLKGPIPSKFWGDMEKTKDAYIPAFDQLVNFPDYLPKNLPNSRSIHHHSSVGYGHGGDGASLKHVMYRHCVMCGKSCLCTASSSSSAEQAAAVAAAKRQMNQEKNGGGGNSSAGSTSSSSSPGPIIPRQNKGLCTKCDVTVWCITQSGLEIKWCKGCKNFRPWAAFGDKGLATKCVKCRERQKEKYAAQKEAAAAAAAAAGGGEQSKQTQAQQPSKGGESSHHDSSSGEKEGEPVHDHIQGTRNKRKAQENRSDDEDPGLGSSSGEGDDGFRQAGEGSNNDSVENSGASKKIKREPPSPEKKDVNHGESDGQQQRMSARRLDPPPDDGSTEVKEHREEREAKERKRLEAAAGLSHLIAATTQM